METNNKVNEKKDLTIKDVVQVTDLTEIEREMGTELQKRLKKMVI